MKQKMHHAPVDVLLARLEAVRQSGPGRWMAKCPAHEDRSPSLSVRVLDDGRILIHCFSGCGAADVVAAMGLNLSDLFPEKLSDHIPAARDRRHIHAAGAALKTISDDALLVAIAAEQIAKGETLSEADHQLLIAAANRVRRARKVAT